MLRYALIFLIVSLIAAALGFWGVAGLASEIARVLFFVFLVLFIITPSSAAARRRPSKRRLRCRGGRWPPGGLFFMPRASRSTPRRTSPARSGRRRSGWAAS